MATPAMKTANELAAERTGLATSRSVMAADRSLMAWVRTALSMIGFGFTIYKVLQGFQESGVQLYAKHSPQGVGLFLVALGTFSMVIGTAEYWFRLKEFSQVQPVRVMRPAFVVALIMSAMGLVLTLSIISRLL